MSDKHCLAARRTENIRKKSGLGKRVKVGADRKRFRAEKAGRKRKKLEKIGKSWTEAENLDGSGKSWTEEAEKVGRNRKKKLDGIGKSWKELEKS